MSSLSFTPAVGRGGIFSFGVAALCLLFTAVPSPASRRAKPALPHPPALSHPPRKVMRAKAHPAARPPRVGRAPVAVPAKSPPPPADLLPQVVPQPPVFRFPSPSVPPSTYGGGGGNVRPQIGGSFGGPPAQGGSFGGGRRTGGSFGNGSP